MNKCFGLILFCLLISFMFFLGCNEQNALVEPEGTPGSISTPEAPKETPKATPELKPEITPTPSFELCSNDDYDTKEDYYLEGDSMVKIAVLTDESNEKFIQFAESLDEISDLDCLGRLEIGGANISDISVLSNFKELRSLDLSETGVEDISSLAKLNKLELLDLSQTQVTDISPISNLTGLTLLYLGHLEIEDFSVLSNLSNLEHLSLARTNIEDISPIMNLMELRQINLIGVEAPEGQIEKFKAMHPDCWGLE